MSPSATAVAYWLVFIAAGALVSFLVLSSGDMGSHAGSSGALGMWLFSMMVSAGAIVTGGILAIFPKARDIGIPFVAAGFGGVLTGVAFALLWMARA